MGKQVRIACIHTYNYIHKYVILGLGTSISDLHLFFSYIIEIKLYMRCTKQDSDASAKSMEPRAGFGPATYSFSVGCYQAVAITRLCSPAPRSWEPGHVAGA